MASRAKKRAERIRRECDIGVLLQNYGHNIIPDASREQQYACDLHGVDNKPSARYYPRTNSVYCFACGKARDPVSLVMEKEGQTFREACDRLEKQFGLPSLAWDEDLDGEDKHTVVDDLDQIIEEGVPFEREAARISRLLDNLVQDHDLDLRDALAFLEAYDRVLYAVRKEGLAESSAKNALGKLHEKIMTKLRERVASCGG